MPASSVHPCLRCGACCATYRVAFYWAEVASATPGGVPDALVEPLRPHESAMRGTSAGTPRCVALEGTLGERVHCTIYPQRPTPCREVAASYEAGAPSAQCDLARARHGLPPLTPSDWP